MFHDSFLRLDGALDAPRGRLATLLCTLTGCAKWSMGELSSTHLQSSRLDGSCKDALAKEPLNAFHSYMTKSMVPTQKLLFGLRKIDVPRIGQRRMFFGRKDLFLFVRSLCLVDHWLAALEDHRLSLFVTLGRSVSNG